MVRVEYVARTCLVGPNGVRPRGRAPPAKVAQGSHSSPAAFPPHHGSGGAAQQKAGRSRRLRKMCSGGRCADLSRSAGFQPAQEPPRWRRYAQIKTLRRGKIPHRWKNRSAGERVIRYQPCPRCPRAVRRGLTFLAPRGGLAGCRALSGSLMKFSGWSKLATEMSSSTASQ